LSLVMRRLNLILLDSQMPIVLILEFPFGLRLLYVFLIIFPSMFLMLKLFNDLGLRSLSSDFDSSDSQPRHQGVGTFKIEFIGLL